MKVKIILFGAAVLLALAVAYAADVTGTWVAESPGRDGNPQKTTFILKAEGAKLTGTMQGAMGDPVQIQEGKVEGDNVSFVVVRNMGGNEMKTTYKGTVSGDELKLTREFAMPPGMGGGPGGGGPGMGPGGGGQGAPGGAPGGPGGGRGGMNREIIAKRVK